jgi:hypothetical protein
MGRAFDALQAADPIVAWIGQTTGVILAAGSRAIPCIAGACNGRRVESLRQLRSLRQQRRRGAADTYCLSRPPCWRTRNQAGHRFSSDHCHRTNRAYRLNRTAGRAPEAENSLTFSPPFSGGWSLASKSHALSSMASILGGRTNKPVPATDNSISTPWGHEVEGLIVRGRSRSLNRL